jgi:hypothetical protein
MEVPLGLAGAVTIAALVAFGIFIHPWLLARRRGAWAVAAITVVLAALFYSFERPGAAAPAVSVALAIAWAALPVLTALIVRRVQKRRA